MVCWVYFESIVRLVKEQNWQMCVLKTLSYFTIMIFTVKRNCNGNFSLFMLTDSCCQMASLNLKTEFYLFKISSLYSNRTFIRVMSVLEDFCSFCFGTLITANTAIILVKITSHSHPKFREHKIVTDQVNTLDDQRLFF